MSDQSLVSMFKAVMDLQSSYSATGSKEMTERQLKLKDAEKVIRTWIEPSGHPDIELVGKLDTDVGGQRGNFGPVPWVRIFSREHSPSAQRGNYIVFLFSADGKSLFLSLNQGTSEFRGNQWRPATPETVREQASTSRQQLAAEFENNILSPTQSMNLAIEEASVSEYSKKRVRNYELGSILSVEYKTRDLDLISDSSIRTQLQEMLPLLTKLYGLNSKPNSDDDSSLRSSSTHPNHRHNFNCLTPEEMQRCNAIVSETDIVFLWPTPTWLDNQSPDSTKPFRELLLQQGLHNSDSQPHGKEYKEELAVYLGFKDSVQTTIGFYRSKNKGKTKRNDRRMSFNTQVLKEFCSAGDAIAVIIESQTEDTMIKFVNLTREKIAASGSDWSITKGEVKPRKKPEYPPGSDHQLRDAEARESQLEMSFKSFLEIEGRTVVTHKYHSGLECDIFDESSGVLYEAKAHAEREDVRMAIGQLFDYGYLEFIKTDVHPELAILLPQRPNKEMEELCGRLKIRLVWPVGDTFVSSTGSV
jgi:hypothetical protein